MGEPDCFTCSLALFLVSEVTASYFEVEGLLGWVGDIDLESKYC